MSHPGKLMLRVDCQWYRERYKDSAGVLDVEAHFAIIGWRQGKDPNPSFSTNWYLREYPDIRSSGMNPFEHFVHFGLLEGRFPNEYAKVAKSLSDRHLINDDWYHRAYPDVGTEVDAASHYLQYGWLENKNPNERFHTEWYLRFYPDIAASRLNPFLHYVDYGAQEGRFPNEDEFLADRIRSTGLFDSRWYRLRYRDLALETDPVLHYVTTGWKERRDPSSSFSTNWYLSNNADVADIGLNPLLHYADHGRIEGRSPKPSFLETIRAQDWWAGKSSPILSIFYGTAVLYRVSLWSLLPALGVLIVAIVSGAMFVSFVNDMTDLEDDRRSGKANRLLGRSKNDIVLLFAACSCLGVLVTAYLIKCGAIAALCFFVMSWIVFSLYSVPPLRLKTRGVFGVIADASGAHLFPVLFAATFAMTIEHRAIDYRWLSAAGIWSFCVGIRGIVTHQLGDFDNDRKVGVETFVLKRGPKAVAELTGKTIFPLELVALAAILFLLNLPALWVAILVYVGLEVWRSRLLHGAILIVGQIRDLRSGIVLPVGFSFYTIFMPLGILIGSAQRHHEDAIILVLHLLMFSVVPARRESLIQIDAAIKYYYPGEKIFTRTI